MPGGTDLIGKAFSKPVLDIHQHGRDVSKTRQHALMRRSTSHSRRPVPCCSVALQHPATSWGPLRQYTSLCDAGGSASASVSVGAPLPACSCQMARTSITRWSKMAGAGGIGNMRQGYDSRRIGNESTNFPDRLVGRSAAGAAVGVEENEKARCEPNGKNPLNQSNRDMVPFQPLG